MKSGFKVLLGFAAGAAAGYLVSKNSEKLAACFDELCYKIDDLRDQFVDYRCRNECDCIGDCDDECDDCCCAEEDEADDSVVEDVIESSDSAEEDSDQ